MIKPHMHEELILASLASEVYLEEWKDVPGFVTYYQVSNLGNVRSLERIITKSDSTTMHVPGKVLTPTYHFTCKNHARWDVGFSISQKPSRHYLHRLVAEAFIGPQPKGYHTCHNDGDEHNNRLCNLRYDLPKNNIADRDKHGRTTKGEQQWKAKLTNNQAIRIKELLREKQLSVKQIAEQFNVNRGIIYHIKSGYTWKHV
jgi:hypothetical protein